MLGSDGAFDPADQGSFPPPLRMKLLLRETAKLLEKIGLIRLTGCLAFRPGHRQTTYWQQQIWTK